MCGIAGLINWGDRAALERMTEIQSHRGPDDRGLWEGHLSNGGWMGMGARRLAILDRTPNGHMPMSTPDGRYTIVYNGEVYNSPQLRRALEDQGCRFRSGSDTEVVLRLYEREGLACLRRLNGMFAFAIWDRDEQELVVARDHVGIKPLYYCWRGDRFAFASELKALLTLPNPPSTLNWQAFRQYLTFLWVPDPATMFEEVAKVPPGHYGVWRDGRFTLTRYWDLAFPPAGSWPRYDSEALAIELRERLVAAVRRQLLSDVPVAAFLSAGLDSSSVVAAMARASSQPVRTITIGFPQAMRRGEHTLDDTAVARRTADYFGCRHTEIVAEPDVVDLLPKLIWHMDEPTADPALLLAYLITREARGEATVLLSGVGGDEVFAGYRKYRAHGLARQYQRLPGFLRRRIIEPLLAGLPSLRDSTIKGHVRLAKKMARSGSLPPRERFIMDGVYLTVEEQDRLLASPCGLADRAADPTDRHRAAFERVAQADFLNQMLYVDMATFMVSLNLNYNDKMSMATSTEVRVPLLDRQLIEWVAGMVPPALKLRRGTSKLLLREAMRPLLPREVLSQRKAGFGAPLDAWLVHDLREMVDDILSPASIQARGIFDPGAVRALIEQQRAGRQDWSLQIWQLLTIELWFRAFANGLRGTEGTP